MIIDYLRQTKKLKWFIKYYATIFKFILIYSFLNNVSTTGITGFKAIKTVSRFIRLNLDGLFERLTSIL